MNKPPEKAPFMAWYRVPELWLILVMLGATVIGSFALLVTAIRTPDQHVTVPNDVPRPSSIPPAQAAPVAAEESRGEPGNRP